MVFNLINQSTIQFLDIIKQVGEYKWHVLVYDSTTKYVKEHLDRDLVSEGVRKYIAFERSLDEKPNPSPVDLPAIYIVQPTEQVMSKIASQMSSSPSTYPSAKVVFTSGVDPSLKNKHLTASNIQVYSQIGLVLAPTLFNTLTSNDPALLGQAGLENNFSADFSCFASKVLATLHSLNCQPTIYFDKTSRSSKALGAIIQQNINNLAQGHRNDKLVIIDRSCDLYALFVHSKFYLGALPEMKSLKPDGTFTFSAGGTQKTASINESDFFMEKVFSSTVSEALIQYKKEVAEVNKNNASKGKPGEKSASELAQNFLHQQVLGQKSTHLQKQGYLIEQVSKLMNSTIQLLIAENDITLNDNPSDKNEIMRLVSDKRYAESDKARLIALHIIRCNGIPQSDFDDIVKRAGLSNDFCKGLENLSKLRINAISSTSQPKPPEFPFNAGESEVYFPKISRLAKAISQSNSVPELEQSSTSHASQFTFPRNGLSVQFSNKAKSGPVKKPRLILLSIGGFTMNEIALTSSLKIKAYDTVFISSQLINPNTIFNELANL